MRPAQVIHPWTSPQPCTDLRGLRLTPVCPAVLLGGLKAHLKEIRRCRRLIVIGCGTSYHAAVAVSAVRGLHGQGGSGGLGLEASYMLQASGQRDLAPVSQCERGHRPFSCGSVLGA